jgi:putative cell wall-binding protein
MPFAKSLPAAQPLRLLLVTLLALAMAVGTGMPAGASDAPPDRLDPPAEGEGPYAEDPSEPADAGMRFSAQPSPRYSLTGERLPRQGMRRVQGANRFLTSVAASHTGWPNGAPAAVLATGEAHADALSAAVLAGAVDGPLLLSPDASLADEVGAELRRLSPSVVYVVGRLTAAVEQDVAALGFEVERIGGSDPYATSFDVAERAVELGADASTVLVASGAVFPDALAASALAAGRRHPILLVPASGGGDALRERVTALGTRRVWVVGGPAAVPDETVRGLPGLERLAGPERTATARAVANRARSLGMGGDPVIASAEAFPDGLSGGVFAALTRNAPIILSYRAGLSTEPARFLAAAGTSQIAVMGGEAALGALVRCQLHSGDTAAFACIEEELQRQGYHVGQVDGRLDHLSVWAFYAFQKAAGLRPTGDFGEAEYRRLLENPRITPRHGDLGGAHHVEIDLARQLVYVVAGGEVRHVLHTSTGKPSTPTVRGIFTVYETRNVRQANRMYRPSFFHRGYAFHGYPEIPLHPASAGCARLYDGDMDFLWSWVQRGVRVATY